MINIDCLYSGSDGNSYLIRSAKASILIDCGGSCRSIEKRLLQFGTCLENISDIFITHEHTDHISAAEIISKKYKINIHMIDGSVEYVPYSPYLKQHLVKHSIGEAVKVKDLLIVSFKLPHDSNENVGYIISDEDDKIGIATDMGTNKQAKKHLIGCRLAVIESNHDVEMLKTGPYPKDLQKRILSAHGHLSNDDAAELALSLVENGTKELWLAHISHENNEPGLPKKVVLEALEKNGYSNIAITECISRKGTNV